MIPFCLPPKEAEEFKRRIISGEIDPAKLNAMTSAERHAFFTDILGEANAGPVNTLFESKLLLKNQQQGMINWAKAVMGKQPKLRKDIVEKIEGMKEVLTPATEDAFLEDLAAQKLGTQITFDEAKDMADLSSKVEETRAVMEDSPRREIGEPATPTEMDYGRAVVNLRNYVGDLILRAGKLTLEEVKSNPLGAAGKGLNFVASNAKSIKASMDNSALFRQGWKTLWTHPWVWQKNARQSFVDLVKAFGSDQVMNEVNADIVSRPTYPLMREAKLAVGVVEEAYPSSLPEKIPGIGRLYRATEHAFSAFVRRTRADVFDKYIDIARRSDVPLDRAELESIGKLTNSLTGRGHLGAIEPVANVVNNVFFSPRLLKSHIDTLLLHPADKMSSFGRKQAAINLLKIIAGSAAILAIARALKPDSVDWDPRSANFGKIRIGNTRFDMTGGMGSVVTLAAREATQSSKSSTTGKVTPLNSQKFGSQTGTDVVYNFFENKLSPAASVLKDIMKGRTFEGKKPSIGTEAVNLFVPMTVTNYMELKKDPKSANMLVAIMADALGISTNTYGPYQKTPK